MENLKLSDYADKWMHFAQSKLRDSPLSKIETLNTFGKWSCEMYTSATAKRVRDAINEYGGFLLLATFAYECHLNYLATLVGMGVAFWAVNTPDAFSILKSSPLIRDNRDCAIATLGYFAIRPRIDGLTRNFLIGFVGGYALYHCQWKNTSAPPPESSLALVPYKSNAGAENAPLV